MVGAVRPLRAALELLHFVGIRSVGEHARAIGRDRIGRAVSLAVDGFGRDQVDDRSRTGLLERRLGDALRWLVLRGGPAVVLQARDDLARDCAEAPGALRLDED